MCWAKCTQNDLFFCFFFPRITSTRYAQHRRRRVPGTWAPRAYEPEPDPGEGDDVHARPYINNRPAAGPRVSKVESVPSRQLVCADPFWTGSGPRGRDVGLWPARATVTSRHDNRFVNGIRRVIMVSRWKKSTVSTKIGPNTTFRLETIYEYVANGIIELWPYDTTGLPARRNFNELRQNRNGFCFVFIFFVNPAAKHYARRTETCNVEHGNRTDDYEYYYYDNNRLRVVGGRL